MASESPVDVEGLAQICTPGHAATDQLALRRLETGHDPHLTPALVAVRDAGPAGMAALRAYVAKRRAITVAQQGTPYQPQPAQQALTSADEIQTPAGSLTGLSTTDNDDVSMSASAIPSASFGIPAPSLRSAVFGGSGPTLASPSAAAPNTTTLTAHPDAALARVDIVSSPPPAIPAVGAEIQGETLHVFNGAEAFADAVRVKPPSWMSKVGPAAAGGAGAAAKGGARAPMPSKIVQVFVKEGEHVEEGAPLVAVEAMKTEHVLRASKAGVVAKIVAKEGDLVPEGKGLVTFEQEAQSDEKAV
ncbi:hypothetical protein JCM3770_004007 [Rhodotorula araucariae]